MALPRHLAERLRLPAICSPLFIISGPDLVLAQCKAGAIGSFPSLNARPLSMLDEWLHRITEELAAWDRDHPETPSAPFAVNQIVHRSNDRLDHDIELCAKYKVPIVITSLGAREDVNAAVHEWGGITLHDVINDRFGRKAIEKGADGLVAVAAGAGGHAGTLSPFALMQELREWFDGLVALSGSQGHGRSILAAQAMGADLAYIGSLFIATREANAIDRYKQMIVECSSTDIVYSNLFSGVSGNYLAPSIAQSGLDPDNLAESDSSAMNFGSAGGEKPKAWKDIWGCGQGIGIVRSIDAAGDVIDRLRREYSDAKQSLDRKSFPTPVDQQIVSGDRVRTSLEIDLRSAKAAAGLQSLGIKRGDTIALFLRNDFPFLEASQAANKIGAYTVPVNWHATADEARYILADSGAKLLVIHSDLLPQIAAGIPDRFPLLVVKTPPELLAAYGGDVIDIPELALEWSDWLQRFDAIAETSSANLSAVIYTSGTTGKPKGVKRSDGAHVGRARIANVAYNLNSSRPMVMLMNGPMYHTAPNSYLQVALAAGANIILQPRFDAEELLAFIERYGVTHMHIVPTMFVRLLRLSAEAKARYDTSSLVSVLHGAAPCPPDIKRAMIDWWGPVIDEYYGSTETGLITSNGSAEALWKPGTVGRPLPSVSIRIVGPDGAILPPGTEGEIFVKAFGSPDFSYIGRDDERREAESDGYVTVGDVGYLDEDGYLFLCDRKRDMIISGGVNIYPAEIEAALQSIDEISDCAVFGIPDLEFGELVCAHIQLVDGVVLEEPELRSRLASKLARFKIPRLMKFVLDLPREDSGKVFKRKLRDEYRVIEAAG